MPSQPLPLAVSMGDPAGIGLDILLAAFSVREQLGLPAFVLYGDPVAVAARSGKLGLEQQLAEVDSPHQVATLAPGVLPIIPVRCAVAPRPGVPDSRNAGAVIEAIERATAAVLEGTAAAIVTNPIAKAVLTAAGFAHPGHTEFLAELAERHTPGRRWTPVMMLAADLPAADLPAFDMPASDVRASGALRVVPLTVHVPLARVPSLLTVSLIRETVRITALDLTRRFGIARPRLWVCGLNPHAGESGTLGREEIDIIAPAVASLQAEGFDIVGPFSADTMFHAAARVRYDAVIAMYHDQALIPLKTLAFDSGVNVTLGLPFVRTSPDHGTAFDIAGTAKANPASFVSALRMARRMTTHAAAYPGR